MDERKPRPAGRDRRLVVRSVRNPKPDLRKLSRALIELAMAEAKAEMEAQAEHQQRKQQTEENDGGAV